MNIGRRVWLLAAIGGCAFAVAAVFLSTLHRLNSQGETIPFDLSESSFVLLGVYPLNGSFGIGTVFDRELRAGRHVIRRRGRHLELNPGKAIHWKWWGPRPIGEVTTTLPTGSWRWELAATKIPFSAVVSGMPRSVAADDSRVYFSCESPWGRASFFACDLDGNIVWSHPTAFFAGRDCRITQDGGSVFMLSTGPFDTRISGIVLKFDGKTGQSQAWEGSLEETLEIPKLWPEDGTPGPALADAISAANGRIYLSFTEAGFIAVLDARDGHYITTISGPQPGPMALSTTPMNAPDGSGKTEVADFGIVVLMGRALSYFVMPHDPPWVAMNTTKWLSEDERITAFTMRAQTMTSGDVQLYLGLGAPHLQVQVRPADDPSGFTRSIGKVGGRRPGTPYDREAFSDIRGLAIDARGRLWVADANPDAPRFCAWRLDGPRPEIVQEILLVPPGGPSEAQRAGKAPSPVKEIATGVWKDVP